MCNCKFSVKMCSRREERHKTTTQLKCGAEKINQNNNFKNTGKQLFLGKSYLQKNLLWMKTPENM